MRRRPAHFPRGGRRPPSAGLEGVDDVHPTKTRRARRLSGGRRGPGRARGMEDGGGDVEGTRPRVGVRGGLRAGPGIRRIERSEGPPRAEVVRRRGRHRRRGPLPRARRPLARRRARGREPERRGRRVVLHQPVEERGRSRGRHARMSAAGPGLARREEAPRRERQEGAGPGDRPPCPGRGSHAFATVARFEQSESETGGRRPRPSQTLSWARVVGKGLPHSRALMSPTCDTGPREDTP